MWTQLCLTHVSAPNRMALLPAPLACGLLGAVVMSCPPQCPLTPAQTLVLDGHRGNGEEASEGCLEEVTHSFVDLEGWAGFEYVSAGRP